MKRRGHVIVLLVAVVCLVLVLGFLTYKNERERSTNPSMGENLCNGKLVKGFEFSEGDYIQYETNNVAHYAISGLYPVLEVGKSRDNYYEMIIGDQFGKRSEKIVLGGRIFVKEGEYEEDESPFFPGLSGEWELVKEYVTVLKYRYEDEQNFTSEQNREIEIENLTILIDKNTGIPVGAYWLSTFLETEAETHHYLKIEDTNIRDLEDGIDEYEHSDIFIR